MSQLCLRQSRCLRMQHVLSRNSLLSRAQDNRINHDGLIHFQFFCGLQVKVAAFVGCLAVLPYLTDAEKLLTVQIVPSSFVQNQRCSECQECIRLFSEPSVAKCGQTVARREYAGTYFLKVIVTTTARQFRWRRDMLVPESEAAKHLGGPAGRGH